MRAGVSRQARQPGGTRQRHFDGTNLNPRKLPDCPQGVRTAKRPTTLALVLARREGAGSTLPFVGGVHAVLAQF